MSNALKYVYSACAKIRSVIDHSKAGSWMDPMIKKLHLSPYMDRLQEITGPERATRYSDFCAFYAAHEAEFDQVLNMLEDDFSRLTMERILQYRKTGDAKLLKEIVVGPQYFMKDIFLPVKDEVFIDGGAFVGDTIESYLKDFAGGGYKKIYAWEPDKANLKALKEHTEKLENIVIIPYGLWEEKTVLSFESVGKATSRVVESQSIEVQKIAVDSIDNLCADDKVTFIKMDIEGSEQAALRGAVNVIKRDKPRLAICIYHSNEDLYKIPLWIKETVPEYKLFVRQHRYNIYDTVVYATL